MNERYQAYIDSPEWSHRRSIELARAGDCCEFCGSMRSEDVMHVHHLSYEHLGAELNGELIVLCSSCHADVHEFPQMKEAVARFANRREWMDENAQRSRELLAHFSGSDEALAAPDLQAGRCDECEDEVVIRWTFGAFELCRICMCRRVAVRDSLAEDDPSKDWIGEEPPIPVSAA